MPISDARFSSDTYQYCKESTDKEIGAKLIKGEAFKPTQEPLIHIITSITNNMNTNKNNNSSSLSLFYSTYASSAARNKSTQENEKILSLQSCTEKYIIDELIDTTIS